MNKISVLIPDGESPFAYHVTACLASAKDVDIHILSKSPQAPARYSRWVKSFHLREESQDWADSVADVCSKVPVDLCLPVGTNGFRYFSQNRDHVEKSARLVLLASVDALAIAGDKARFAEVLHSHDLPHPHSVTRRAQFDREISNLSFPVLVKARFGGGGQGIDKSLDRSDLLGRANGRNDFFDEFIIQEYTEGEDMDCSVFCREGKILAYAIQKGIYVNTESYLSHTAIEFVHHSGVLDIAARLMSALKWDGIAHIDTRIRSLDQSIDIIEINTRYWGSLEGALHAGINFPYIACRASLGEEFPLPDYLETKYMSAPAALKRMARGKPVAHLFKETNLMLHLKDPLPVIMRLMKK
jgi:D-aspartate ligase